MAASAAPATAAFSLDSGSNPPHLVESLNSSRVISKLYHPISRANNHINRYCKKKKKTHSNIREYKKRLISFFRYSAWLSTQYVLRGRKESIVVHIQLMSETFNIFSNVILG